MKWWILGAALAAALAAAAIWAGGGRLPGTAGATPTPLPPVTRDRSVTAEAKVVPARRAALSFQSPGTVAAVLVTEGDMVVAGQSLAKLDDAELKVSLAQAEADLRAAEAQLTRLLGGPSEPEIAAAQAAVDAARAGVTSARGGLSSASAALADVQSGASAEELDIARRRVAQVENELWGVQNQRDGICGRTGRPGFEESDCDGARARVGVAEEQLRIARLELARVERGADAESVAASRGQVGQASGQVDGAAARLRQAEAELERLLAGATPEEVAVADARVLQAQAARDQVRLRLERTTLTAPFAGEVAFVDARPGELISAGIPVIRIADTASWLVETDDLTELGVVYVSVGAQVAVTVDALPDVELTGTVESVRSFGENRLGDIVYTAVIRLDDSDPRLRWNMTAAVVLGQRD